MILPPPKSERQPDPLFASQTLQRLPLAEAFYLTWASVAPDDFLEALFEKHRGHCYTDELTFHEIVLALTNALTRFHGSANRALEKAIENDALSVEARAVYGKLSRLPLPLAEALLSALTARLRLLFPPGLFRSDIPASLNALNVVVLDGKKIKKAAKRLLATRGRPGKLFGGKLLVAYTPANGLAVAMAADADGEANDIRLMPRVMPLAREAVPGPRLWVADRQFCDLDQPQRFTQEGDHYLVRFSKKTSFHADPARPGRDGRDNQGRAFREEWGWMGAATQGERRCYVRRITLQRGQEEAVILVTDLTDEETYPAADLLAVYLMRWQIENVFQQITEVFELRHLIGSAPKATVFQAALCLVIYNVLQVLRGIAALAAPVEATSAVKVKVEDVSSEKVFEDMHEHLISLHTTLKEEEMLGCLPKPLTLEETRQRLRVLVGSAWSRFWKKARNKRPRKPKAKARQSGAHTSVHKILLADHARKRRTSKSRIT